MFHPPVVALIGDLTSSEFLVICVAALLVLGPQRLPDAARQAGQFIAKARKQLREFTSDMHEVLDDPAMEPLKEFGKLASQPRKTLAEYARSIDSEDSERFWDITGEEVGVPSSVPDTPTTSPSAPPGRDSVVETPAEPPTGPTPAGDAAGSGAADSNASDSNAADSSAAGRGAPESGADGKAPDES